MEHTADNCQWQQAGDTATIAEHQKALLRLLEEFDRVARELKTPYCLFAGTLLGAVRHNGFIPWDDDLDVAMRRADYDRFMREAPAVINKEVFYLQNEFSDNWPMFFSKLRINNTACIEKYHPKNNVTHQGVYMDIFPCDNAFSTKFGRIIQFVCSKVIIAKGLDQRGYDNDGGLKKPFMMLCRLMPGKFFHWIVRGPKKTGEYIHSFFGGASKFSHNIFPADCFGKTVLMDFEGEKFPVPEKFDEMLRIQYGDYQTMPTEDEREMKRHVVLVDLKNSYEKYEHYREGMKFDVHIRSIR